jgi:hypothetical protein
VRLVSSRKRGGDSTCRAGAENAEEIARAIANRGLRRRRLEGPCRAAERQGGEWSGYEVERIGAEWGSGGGGVECGVGGRWSE